MKIDQSVEKELRKVDANNKPLKMVISKHGKKIGRPRKEDKSRKLEDRMYNLQDFPELFLGLESYKWQKQVLEALGRRESKVGLKAANGSGKTDRIVAPAILWHMLRFPGSLVVVTAGVYRQVVDALWPSIRKYSVGLGGEALGWKVTESHVTYDNGSRCVGFSATEASKAEGWHRQGRDDNLLWVIDEAKGVPNDIFAAVQRCQPSRLLVLSSPGASAGFFYDLWAKRPEGWDLFTVTAYDCPHITPEWIKSQIDLWGENHPVVRSMVFAEFMDDDGASVVLPNRVLQAALSSPPKQVGDYLTAGCDFAAGGDENVLCIRKGNAVEKLICWKERNTMSAVGRFVTEFKKHGLNQENIYADAGGMGIPMCDAIREAGWDVRRVNNGDPAWDGEKFANRSVEMWVKYARMVETGNVVVYPDELVHRQLTTRQLLYNSKGKLCLESKDDMKARGLGSPDRADAIILAFCGGGESLSRMITGRAPRDVIGEWMEWQENMGNDENTLAGCSVGS